MTAFAEVPLAMGQRYRSIEIQRLDHDGLSGLLVISHRPSGELDVTASPGLPLDELWFRQDPFLSHMTFGSIGVGEYSHRRFEVGPRQVNVDVEVSHVDGATIRVEMEHRFATGPQPWFVPAVRQDAPTTMRFMSADYIRLMPRWSKRLRVTLDGSVLTPRPFLLPTSVAPFNLARYSGGVFGVGLNHPHTTPGPRSTGPITASNGTHHFTATLHGLSAGADSGRFTVESPLGSVATGTWATRGVGPNASIELSNVKQEWFPGWRSPTRLALYGIRRFRRRNESWRWEPISGQASPTSGRWHTANSV